LQTQLPRRGTLQGAFLHCELVLRRKVSFFRQNAQNHRVAAGEYRLKNSRTATPVHFFVLLPVRF
jgi:hypothetical protein